MSYNPSLDTIINEWVEQERKKHGGDLKQILGVKPTIYKAAKTMNVKYNPVEDLPGEPWVGATLVYDNGLDIEQQFDYMAAEELTQTTSATLERSIELGTEVQIGVDFPGIASTKTKFTIKGGRKSTDSKQESRRSSLQIAPKFRVPALTKASATLNATKSKKQVKWVADVAVGGAIHFHYEQPNKKGDYWYLLPAAIKLTTERMKVLGWSFDTMKVGAQRDFWEALWPYEELEKWNRTISGENRLPDDKEFIIAKGMISGTLTYETFTNIHVVVKKLGPATGGKAAALTGYIAGDFNFLGDESGEVLEIVHIETEGD